MAKTTKKGAAAPAEPFNSNSEVERLVGQFGREFRELAVRVDNFETYRNVTVPQIEGRLDGLENRVDDLEIDECAKSVDTADNAAANAATNAAARAAIRAIVLEVIDEQRRANPLAR